jgi:AcrR family transcriptional regulator
VDEPNSSTVMRELISRGLMTDPHSARGKLLQVAAHLFRHKGYERTTVRDLAAAVGIQSGSIFHHFRSKDEILCSVMEQTAIYNTELMRAALAQTRDVRQRVLALITCELQSIMGGTGEAMAVMIYEWRSLSAQGQTKILVLREAYEQLWLQVLTEAKDCGLLEGDVFVTRRLLTGALSWTTTWFRADGSMTLDQLADQALVLLLKNSG